LQILVRDNNIDQALRGLKKKMQREGVFREMKRRRRCVVPASSPARKQSLTGQLRRHARGSIRMAAEGHKVVHAVPLAETEASNMGPHFQTRKEICTADDG
jgi:small subunit ribosomal protein S21